MIQKYLPSILSGLIGGTLVLGAIKLTDSPKSVTTPETTAQVKQVSYGDQPAPVDFTKAAGRTLDAVVHIKASESKASAQQRQRQYTDPFEYFFGRGFQFEQQPRSGTGSGVIYSSDGYILTNNHVVEFADEFIVTLHDNREYHARMVGRDANTDMAVIKIDASDLPAIDIGNSDDVKVGEWVLAVGNPFDLTSTVTAGIVSAKGRDINIIKGNTAIESFIQTDAAVNPGNSGGALVDINGKLIGINSAISTPTGVYAGYAFAIPVNLATRIADDLIKYGEYKRAYLGVDIVGMDQEIARQLKIDYVPGVYIDQVDPNGSAGSAGVSAADIITKIDGKNIATVPELRETVGRSKVGDQLLLTVLRNGKEKEIPVRLKTKNTN